MYPTPRLSVDDRMEEDIRRYFHDLGASGVVDMLFNNIEVRRGK